MRSLHRTRRHGNWELALNSRLEQLTVALTDLTKKQADSGERTRNQLPEITGNCYLADRSRPAAGKEVNLLQFPAMTVLRKARTDDEGRFRFGMLPAGDYCVTTSLSGEKNPIRHEKPLFWVQSQPLYVSEGSELPPVELDVYFAHGSATVNVKLKTAVPATIKVGDATWQVGVQFVLKHDWIKLPWRPSDPLPRRWPALGVSEDGYIGVNPSPDVSKGLYAASVPLPAGSYRFATYVGIYTSGGMGGMGGGFFSVADSAEPASEEGPPDSSKVSAASVNAALTEFRISDGETVRLEVEFPDDVVDQLRKAIELHVKLDGQSPALVYGRVSRQSDP